MNNNGKNMRTKFILFFVISLIAVFVDRYTKILAVTNLKGRPPHILIKGVLEFYYSENTGAAFSILQGKQWFFYIITVLVLFVICYIVFKLPFEKKYMPLFYILCFIFSGAVGNFIDRVMYAYVVDFIYIRLIDFPIFNVADMYISIATAVLIICLLLLYKEEDFSFIRKKE